MNEFVPPEEIEGPTIWVSSVAELEALMVAGRCISPDACRKELEEYGATGWLDIQQPRCPCPPEVTPYKVRMRPHIRIELAPSGQSDMLPA